MRVAAAAFVAAGLYFAVMATGWPGSDDGAAVPSGIELTDSSDSPPKAAATPSKSESPGLDRGLQDMERVERKVKYGDIGDYQAYEDTGNHSGPSGHDDGGSNSGPGSGGDGGSNSGPGGAASGSDSGSGGSG